jgi:uncharacterized protein YutE (UPF0331/DUF86 family)
MLAEVRRAVEDLSVDLSEDTSVSTQCRRDVLAAKEEANGALEKMLEDGALDELGETGVVGCSKDEHVTELTVKRKMLVRMFADMDQRKLTHGPCRKYSSQ